MAGVVNNGRIHKLAEDAFLVADEGGWLPGVYNDRKTALKALEMSYVKLEEIWSKFAYKQERSITFEELTHPKANETFIVRVIFQDLDKLGITPSLDNLEKLNGFKVIRYEVFYNDGAFMEVNKLPEPLPEYLTLKPDFKFSR
jgi:hypothetical protein